MIQRIQTLYLIIGSFSMFLSFVFPFAVFKGMNGLDHILSALSFIREDNESYQLLNHIPYMILASFGGGVLLANVLFYKNLNLQRKIGRLLYVLLLASIGAMFWMIFSNMKSLNNLHLQMDFYHVGFYLPFVALIMNFMANRGIRRDQNLLKSLDRLRWKKRQ